MKRKKQSRAYAICVWVFTGLVIVLRVLLRLIRTVCNIQPILFLIDGLIFIFMIATWIFAGLLCRERLKTKDAEENGTQESVSCEE